VLDNSEFASPARIASTSILDTIDHPALFGPWFKKATTWSTYYPCCWPSAQTDLWKPRRSLKTERASRTLRTPDNGPSVTGGGRIASPQEAGLREPR
jgi:hypothetical protein